ncbi:Pyridoxal phosphate-dependent decarboxylase, partial [Metarhizium hybridum]
MAKVSLEKLLRIPPSLTQSISQTKVDYLNLGHSGLRVSRPILGGLHLGSRKWLPWVLEEEKALPILKAAYDLGVNTWDTANVYSNGESERIIAKALSKYKIPRNKVVLMTKCYRVMSDPERFDPGSGVTMHHELADYSKDYVNQWGLSRRALFSAVEASLDRLNTSYIDVLQIHRFDHTVPPEETMSALNDLIRAGMVRYIGASSMWTFQFATLQHIAETKGLTKFISMQNHYNLIYREEEREMNQYCKMTGVGLIPWGPLASGRLARRPTQEEGSLRASCSAHGSLYESDDYNVDMIIQRVAEIAEKRGWPMSHVSLAWLNRRVTAPIIGFGSVGRIEEALAARGKELSRDEEQYLEEFSDASSQHQSIHENYAFDRSMRDTKKMLNRADELDDLYEAVRALIIPHVRAADEACSLKSTGQLHTDDTQRQHNVLVEPYPPKALQERFQFTLPDHEGNGKDGLMRLIRDVLRYSVNTWDQGFMDKLTSSTNPVGVISEIVLGILNTNVHVYHVAPALSVIEKVTGRTLAAYFGFNSPSAGGISCQGGSASNLTSLVVARNSLYPDCKLNGGSSYQFAIFTSCHGHFSMEKAAITCGMGLSSVVHVPVNDDGRMNVNSLRKLVIQAKAQGKTPLYVNATAGTTVLGVFDPLHEIKTICEEFGMWFHVDASWGGSIIFSAKHRHKLTGCELADSLTISPHKMLNVPMTCSFLLTNNLSSFYTANSLDAGYLFHDTEDDEVWDLANLTLQCGRRADSLKMALAWTYYGAAGFERRINHAFKMAAHLSGIIQKSPDFELVSPNPPPCLQVCFYYTPGGEMAKSERETSRRTRAMVEKMVDRGFMFDFAPGPKGDFFRVVVNCDTLLGTVEGFFKGLEAVGKQVVV